MQASPKVQTLTPSPFIDVESFTLFCFSDNPSFLLFLKIQTELAVSSDVIPISYENKRNDCHHQAKES